MRTSGKHCQFKVERYRRDWGRIMFRIKRRTGWSWERIAEQMGVGHHVLDNLRYNQSEPTHSLGELLLEWDRVTEQVSAVLGSAPKATELHP